MIVIALLTRLFSSNGDDAKKKQKPTSAMPPFSNNKPLSTPVESERPVREKKKPVVEVKSLEDFAQEIFGQLQQKVEKPALPVEPTSSKASPVASSAPVAEKPLSRMEQSNRSSMQPRSEMTRSGLQERKELGADRAILQRSKQQRATIVIPTSRQELVQSIVMAEVLGKPKATRSNRI